MTPQAFDPTQETILVHISVTMKGVTAKSQMLSKEAADTHDGDRRSFSAGVIKLQKEALGDITTLLTQARTLVKEYTLPWDRSSWDLCPVNNYPMLQQKIGELQNKLYDAVDALAANYDHLYADYLRRVNDVADEKPFPSREELRSNFGIELQSLPLARTSDIRLKFTDPSALEAYKKSVDEQMADALKGAQGEIVDRIRRAVSHLKEMCEKDGRTAFHDSLIGNIKDLVEVLPSLNITNDTEIARIINRVKSDFTDIEVSDLKSDPKFKAVIAQSAGSVLDDIKRSFGR